MADSRLGMQRTAVLTAADLLQGRGATIGTTFKDYDGFTYMFCKAAGAISSGGTATVSSGVATAGAGTYTAQATLATGEFGWFKTNAAQDATPTGPVSEGTVTPVA